MKSRLRRHTMRIQNIGKVIAAALLTFFPFAASAQVVISEIMYDLPGTEGSGEHDWVEVFNAGTSAVDISSYRFFEANTNHTLKLERGSATIPSGGYAVIASATTTFLTDWLAFDGTLFDSSFNLNSTGELIGIRVDSSDTTHDFTYSPVDTATNNGNSLQRVSISGTSFTEGAPTPGTGSLSPSSDDLGTEGGQNGQTNTSTTTTTTTTTTSSAGANEPVSSASNFPVEPQIFAYAGKDRETIAGADSVFEARAFNKDKELIKPGRFLWTFGDGASAEGQTVMHHFPQPGRYAVVLYIADGLFSASHQIIVTALPVSISLSVHNNDIIFSNKSSKNLDLSYWSLRSGGKLFMIPKNTILLGGASVPFIKEVTNLFATPDASLLYPNGVVAAAIGANISITPPEYIPSMKNETIIPTTDTVDPTDYSGAQEIVAEDATSAAQVAAVAATASSYVWWLGVLGLAVAGGGALVVARRAGKREWDIVEE
ncbi:MAG: lamin tail domain-containing protein [bacterium]|nr:lamin tail domain-containing protein [bacterium]